MIQNVLIALALAMDCFAVSVVCAVILRKTAGSVMLRLAFLLGFFQALMPLIGGKMIVDSFKEEEKPSLNPGDVKTQVLLAVATSIDALAVGISYACTGYDTLGSLGLPLLTIGVVSFLMSILGYLLGTRFGEAVNRKMRPELLGGIILLCIGVRILIEHLGS